ncbi:MAG: hypothetical protein J6L70_01255 [Alphaproteobacteria bacterium]|nr:hypothetical protein [Alphaproteobacteria bacterium]
MKKIFIVYAGIMPVIANAVACPSGMMAVSYDDFAPVVFGVCPAGYVAHDLQNVCANDSSGVCWLVRLACGAGITQMKTSAGVDFPIYATRQTNPSLSVRYNNTTCYMDLEQGKQSGTINLNYNGVVYHMIPN